MKENISCDISAIYQSALLRAMNTYGITDIQYCNCGAWTFIINGESFSVLEKNVEKAMPYMKKSLLEKHRSFFMQNAYCCCNHCVNNWGLDIDEDGYGIELEKVKTIPVVASYHIANIS